MLIIHGTFFFISLIFEARFSPLNSNINALQPSLNSGSKGSAVAFSFALLLQPTYKNDTFWYASIWKVSTKIPSVARSNTRKIFFNRIGTISLWLYASSLPSWHPQMPSKTPKASHRCSYLNPQASPAVKATDPFRQSAMCLSFVVAVKRVRKDPRRKLPLKKLLL